MKAKASIESHHAGNILMSRQPGVESGPQPTAWREDEAAALVAPLFKRLASLCGGHVAPLSLCLFIPPADGERLAHRLPADRLGLAAPARDRGDGLPAAA